MTHVQGLSAFGLNDCVFQLDAAEPTELGFYLADAVLPMNPFGHICIGDEAEGERIHTGLYWPPEARIQPSEPLRRVPIPIAWRVFVEAGDRTIRWNVGRGISFPLSRILANHVVGLMTNKLQDHDDLQLKSGSRKTKRSLQVIAIPNNLDEFGQEALLREFTA